MNVFRRRHDTGTGPGRASAPEGLRLLALTRDPEEWNLLREIAAAEGWTIFWAHSSERARELIGRYSIAIAVCDRDLPDEDWRQVVPKLADLLPPVCVLLASNVADEYLWREVVQRRGFEVLTKPFDRERVVRTVRFAWRWWSKGQSAQA